MANDSRMRMPEDDATTPIEMLLKPEPVSGIASLKRWRMLLIPPVWPVTVNGPNSAPSCAVRDQPDLPLISIPGWVGALEC